MDVNPNQPASSPQPTVSNPAEPISAGPVAGKGDLYSQITAEDEEVVVVKKKNTTNLVSTMAVFMKITFWLDEFRRSNERFFMFLGTIWASIMGVLYLSGVVTLFLSVFSFLQLPTYLRNYFEERGIQYDSLEMSDYSFSEISVKNLHDSQNTYSIPNIQIHSTFADFLQNRVRMVEARGLQVNLKSDGNQKLAGLDLLVRLLKTFSNPAQTGLDLQVNSIRLNNAVLNIQTFGKTVPVAFSLSGIYSGNNQIVIPFSVNEDFLKMDASLSVDGPDNKRVMAVKINLGALTLPTSQTENISGDMTIETNNSKIQKIQMNILLSYAFNSKTIRMDLKNNGDNTFDGSMLFTLTDSNKQPQKDMTLVFKNVMLSEDGTIKTHDNLSINIRKLIQNETIVESLETTLNGDLECFLSQGKCEYTLAKDATLKMNSLTFNIDDNTVRLPNNPSFKVKADKQKVIILQFTDPTLQLKLPTTNIELTGYLGKDNKSIVFNAEKADLSLSLAQKSTEQSLVLNVQNANYITPGLSLNQMNITTENLLNDTGKLQFKADSVTTTSNLLLKPISLDMIKVGQQTSLDAKVIGTDLHIQAQGTFNPFKRTFVGRFVIPAFELASLPFTLSDLSSAFSDNITDISGLVMLSGQLKYAGENNIAGPMYLATKDVSFKWGEIPFSGINSALTLQSLSPFVSNPNQKLFIKLIQGTVPLSNLLLGFQINSQSLRLSEITGQIANQPVMSSAGLINLKNPVVTLNLKTAEEFDIQNTKGYFNIPGIDIQEGRASLLMPINLSETGIDFADFTLKMYNTTLTQNSSQNPILALFDQGNTAYSVRTGQFILSKDKTMTVDIDGWILPSREKDSFGPTTIQSDNFFKPSAEIAIPKEIKDLQDQLFR